MALTVTEPAVGFVYQRNKMRRYESIPLAGTWTGTKPDRVQFRLQQSASPVTPWTEAPTYAINDNGTLTLETGVVHAHPLWYRVDVRTLTAAGSVLFTQLGSNDWGVGSRVWLGGQSNNQFWSGSSNPTNAVFDFQPLSARTRDGSHLTYVAGLVWSVADIGPGEKQLNDDLSNALGCVVAVYNAAIDSASLNKAYDLGLVTFRWHQPTTPLINPAINLKEGMEALLDTGGIECGIWNLGETEAGQASRSSTFFTTAEHVAGLRRLFKNARLRCGRDFPVFIYPMGAVTVAGLSVAQEDGHTRMRAILSESFVGDNIFVVGAGHYAFEHNGVILPGTWSIDSGDIWVASETIASTIDQLILDDGLGALQVSKVACTANGQWFYDSGTDQVFVFSDGSQNPAVRWADRGVFPVARQSDVYHIRAEGYQRLVSQVVDGVMSCFRGLSPERQAGPRIRQVRYGKSDNTVVDIYVEHDVDGSSLVAVGGALRTTLFRVEDDGVAVAVSSATIVGNNLVHLVLGAAVTGVGTFGHISRSGHDGSTTNTWVQQPLDSPTSGPCQDDNARYLRPRPLMQKIEAYKGRSA